MKKQKEQEPPTQKEIMKNYACTFAAGYTAGMAGEIFTAWQDNQFTPEGLTRHTIRDNCWISGVQQVAKDYSKALLKSNSKFREFSSTNPFIFGAATGLPMWAITRAFATPLQNVYKKDTPLYQNYARSVAEDVTYHTIKNGLDEVVAAYVFPIVLPKFENPALKKLVEGSIAGIVGGSTYVLAWPAKTVLTGQSLAAAAKLGVKNTPKVAIKKIVYGLARPEFVKLINSK
ncbi:hypothetical protein TRFO_34717 [Tritrichomonas foetus]|uniref:Mitochondrial carrier protein n=1 Tax=Tritrichomonas foetus TaxID=1144522 RepID=A0A1J4JIF4_9EUKA|nr:hypothetical protein TRFO_34717 [Tritrichomonas foetus]|eukprot:OHS98922.1 hypothetical protein TRFO_34717 [Tritrichomonas foetus]